MTAKTLHALVCDKDGCTEQLQAGDRETALELRIRAARDNGWRFEHTKRGPVVDFCRWHS